MIKINESKNLAASVKELDLGKRKVSRMNFSFIVTLPKRFVRNTPYGEIREVSLTMLEDGCLKLTPIHNQNEPTDLVNL